MCAGVPAVACSENRPGKVRIDGTRVQCQGCFDGPFGAGSGLLRWQVVVLEIETGINVGQGGVGIGELGSSSMARSKESLAW